MKTALIIGAGPAGLTAGYELLEKTGIIPIIIESEGQVGGLSKTINYQGNKIDIGGHRFFSKSKEIISWWLKFLPLEESYDSDTVQITYQNHKAIHQVSRSNNIDNDKIMLVRKRKSRVLFRKKLFDYPLTLSLLTLKKLGITKTIKACVSYVQAKISPIKPEDNLEQFFKNRFGKELYETFFKDYTEKVWGVPCDKLPASWGQQRVKNLNVGTLISHAIKSIFKSNKSLDQKGTSTSLIEQFLYPKYGPGQMWETVADKIKLKGGSFLLNTVVTQIMGDGVNNILSVEVKDNITGYTKEIKADYFFSTMPVKDLISNMKEIPLAGEIKEIAYGLEYRDFLIVGILADDLLLKEKDGTPITDNWIYIQEKNIKAGRLQFFHNWSPFMITNENDKWIGVEYFCNETDLFWNISDTNLSNFAIDEMEQIGILERNKVKDTLVVRVKKAYPSYYGSYKDFSKVQQFLNTVENLFPIGRNGMHRYNNTDHSMLTAMAAVENIILGRKDKTNIWDINTDDEYHEGDKND